MYFKIIVVVCNAGWLLLGVVSSFRILAPAFVCPKDEDAVIDQPDNTIITLQTEAGIDMNFTWSVRWYPLKAPSQRFTLALWRAVRKLERHLNGPQIEPGVYVIDNSEDPWTPLSVLLKIPEEDNTQEVKKLLSGVNYIFNVTALSPETDEIVEKSFHIDNIKGDQKLLIEGQSNKFSIVLVGGQLTYADLDYVLEAQVITCYKTQDYYFEWTVSSSDNSVDVSDARGSRLEIKANSLSPGLFYNVICKLFKYSDGEFITENALPIEVLHRDLNVHFNVDVLVISVGTTFDIQTNIKTIDYSRNQLEITWKCTLNDEKFEEFEVFDESIVTFPSGLPSIGKYIVSVTISILGVSLTTRSSARVIAVGPQLPAIEVYLTPRLINQDSIISLSANITNVVPGCSITWYFIDDECFLPTNAANPDICTTDEKGVPISETINFYSFEENFLNELTDYSNETTWKLLSAQLQAATGTARVVANCQCNMIDHCSAEGTVYADVTLVKNEKPGPGEILVMPETGTAMETMFRISTLASLEPNRPVQYTFFCGLANNDSLILGTNVEHLAIETLLPYIDGGTFVWVEVCDSLGACSIGSVTSVDLAPGDARTLNALIKDVQALVMRCEIGLLRRLVLSTIVTYTNADQTVANEKFTTTLLSTLQGIDQNCTEGHYDQYDSFLHWLSTAGLDTSDLI